MNDPDHSISLKLLLFRISVKRSFGSLTISFTFVPSCLVWCSFKEPLPLYAASFPMIFFKAWIIIICSCYYPVRLGHEFSTCMHPHSSFLGTQRKAPLGGCCINIQFN